MQLMQLNSKQMSQVKVTRLQLFFVVLSQDTFSVQVHFISSNTTEKTKLKQG